MTFKWNGEWEDGNDHKGEIGFTQYWLRLCANCGHRRGLHTGERKGIILHTLERDTICPTY